MGHTLYLECNAGISGDMFVASLLDLGVNQERLLQALASIPVEGYEIEIGRKIKSGLNACDFSVLLEEGFENHDHDMHYLHGQEHSHEKEAMHDHGQEKHSHKHELLEHSHRNGKEQDCQHAHIHEQKEQYPHGHDQNHVHAHSHRGLQEIRQIIEHTDISERAKKTANRIFDILAESESKAHGLPKEEVHFHEVGAIDSIVDIIAAAVCLDFLDITEVIVPQISEGRGMIRCQHGIIPIPVPATANIMEKYQIPMQALNVDGEFITPTGAAIVAAIRTGAKLPAKYQMKKIGMGAGKREYEIPSLLRAMLLEESREEADFIYKLESNIDDCSGEILGYVMERLLEAGARDVHYIPVFMKKNRPAYQLNVICKEEDIKALENIIFEETTTIGIRKIRMERTVLPRKIVTFDSSMGKVDIKVVELSSGLKAYPEYESVRKLAKSTGNSYDTIYQRVLSEYRKEL